MLKWNGRTRFYGKMEPLRRGGHPGPGAFTLIELLVVIAIISLLAAILFPVFGRVREKSRQTACQSNLRQIGLGILQYSQDYDEKMPYATLVVNSYGYYWQDMIFPYVKSDGVFTCPSTSSNAGIWPYQTLSGATFGRKNGGGPGGGHKNNTGSYIANASYHGGAPGTPPMPVNPFVAITTPVSPTSVSKIASPATSLLCMDGNSSVTSTLMNATFITWQYGIGAGSAPTLVSGEIPAINGSYGTSEGAGTTQSTAVAGSAVGRHQGRMNALFCDGHVKSVAPADMMAVSTSNFLNGNTSQPALKFWSVEDD